MKMETFEQRNFKPNVIHGVQDEAFYCGVYMIEKHNEEDFKITWKTDESEITHEVIICGGDLESILGMAFLNLQKKAYYKGEAFESF